MSAIHDPRYQHMLARLREARKQADMTQVEAARALGRPQNFISKCETGERRIDPIDLMEFAKLYRQRFEFFLPEANDPVQERRSKS